MPWKVDGDGMRELWVRLMEQHCLALEDSEPVLFGAKAPHCIPDSASFFSPESNSKNMIGYESLHAWRTGSKCPLAKCTFFTHE